MYVFADLAGNAVGTITVDDGEVSGLWVDPDRQRGGVGRALLAHAERLRRSAAMSRRRPYPGWDSNPQSLTGNRF